ncbi:TPA: glycosyltransferase [Citrobacter braakii]
MKRVLFISAFHPGGVGEIGAGEAICGDNLKKFLEHDYTVDVIVFSPQGQRKDEVLANKCATYTEKYTSKSKLLSGILFNCLKGSFLAPWFFTRVTKAFTREVQTKINSATYDVVWLDFPSVLGVVERIEHNNIQYFAHDIVSQRISRTKINNLFFPFVTSVESKLLSKLADITTMSVKDKELIEKLGFAGPVTVAKLGEQKVGRVDNAVEISSLIPFFSGKRNLVFFGNMKRSENHWSIVWFIFFHFIRMKKERKDLNLWILGLQPRRLLKMLENVVSGVHVIGAVDDPTPAFVQADLNIAPLLYGAGVKIKVLQMLDAGARVVATDVGAEGIQQHENLYVVDKFSIGNKILELLD